MSISRDKQPNGLMLFKPIGKNKQSDTKNDKAFLVGNDPDMPDLNEYKIKGKLGLVATSGFRALKIAAQLSKSKYIPQIILIDMSEKVCQLWCKLQNLCQNYDEGDSFLEHLPAFLIKNKSLYRQIDDKHYIHLYSHLDCQYLNQNLNIFLKNLIDQSGYNFFKSMLLQTKIICQNWTDSETFKFAKDYFEQREVRHVVTYPSNILPFLNFDELKTVYANIQLLNPRISIHTNSFKTALIPNKYFFIQQETLSEILEKFLPDANSTLKLSLRKKISRLNNENEKTFSIYTPF